MKDEQKEKPYKVVFRPAYVMIPKSGCRCSVSGLNRPQMMDLVIPCQANDFRPPVRCIEERSNKGRVTERRIPTDELLEYLDSKLEYAKSEICETNK